MPIKEITEMLQTVMNIPADMFDYELVGHCLDSDLDGVITFDDQINLVVLLDKNCK